MSATFLLNFVQTSKRGLKWIVCIPSIIIITWAEISRNYTSTKILLYWQRNLQITVSPYKTAMIVLSGLESESTTSINAYKYLLFVIPLKWKICQHWIKAEYPFSEKSFSYSPDVNTAESTRYNHKSSKKYQLDNFVWVFQRYINLSDFSYHRLSTHLDISVISSSSSFFRLWWARKLSG